MRAGLSIPSDEIQRQSMRDEMLRRASPLEHVLIITESDSKSSKTIDVESRETAQSSGVN